MKLVKLFVIFCATCVEVSATNDQNDLSLTLTEHKNMEEVCI